MPANLLMGITTLGSTRIGQIGLNNLKFVVTHVAYGTGGYDPFDPPMAVALNPAAVALVGEIFRKFVPLNQTHLDTIETPRGRETTYTSVGGLEFNGLIGEAGIFATITDPGSTGLPLGQQFLLAQAHFPRIVFNVYSRLSIKWPVDYSP